MIENINKEHCSEQEWRWCLVGNIVEIHEFGENKEIKHGTKHFSPGTRVYLAPANLGDGYENINVIGKIRHHYKYIEIVMRREYIENFRLQKVFKPAIIKLMDNSCWRWWGNTDADRNEIIEYLQWLNPKKTIDLD